MSSTSSGSDENPRFVVGIGASAGGLKPLLSLVGRIAGEPSIATVVVQHLAPTHDSMLTSLLSRTSASRIETAHQGTRPQAGCVYVIPPNVKLTLVDGALALHAEHRNVGMASHLIDALFESLARDCGARAIGVVLSGSGHDGTSGLRAIHDAGGTTFVQEPSSAQHDAMPRSALESGIVDFCLEVDALAEALLRLARGTAGPLRNSQREPVLPSSPGDHERDALFARLVTMVRTYFKYDLTHYKRATIERRIERRMSALKQATLSDYVAYAEQNVHELAALYDEVLINVTRFFRDDTPFEVLAPLLAARLRARAAQELPLRIWVAACATGEEAYSLAMLLCELMDQTAARANIQIFATDADPDCIRTARRGSYARALVAELSPARRDAFFVARGNEYRVTRRVREMVVFAVHDVLRQPPLSRLDLVSCRNLLIYLQPSAQRRVVHALHYALHPGGLLLLGTSETVSDAHERFSLIDRKNKLYEKLPTRAWSVPPLAAAEAAHEITTQAVAASPAIRRPVNLQALIDSKILELYGPAGIVVDADLNVLYFRGHTMPFLRPANGAASLQLMRLMRIELHIELKRCTELAFASADQVSGKVAYRDGEDHVVVRILCVPLEKAATDALSLLLVLLERRVVATSGAHALGDGDDEGQSKTLQGELASLREYLQVVLEEKELATEELQSANEELQSANEELQSTNEELETSKEELQSTNEELTTLNEELENRMTELSVANDDLRNVLAGVDNVVVIVDLDLRIRRYTAAAEKMLGLVASDVGRGVEYADARSGNVGLVEKTSSVVATLKPVEEDVLAANGRWYALRITPYRTAEHSIRGAVITLLDIDVRKRAAELSRDIGEYAGKFLSSIGHPLVIVNASGRVAWANEHFYAYFGRVAEETVGSQLGVLGAFDFVEGELRTLLRAALEGEPFRKYKPAHQPDPARDLSISGNRLPLVSEVALALLSIEWTPNPSPERSP